MNILNSLAIQPQIAKGIPRMETDFRSPPLSERAYERTQFESAIATAQKQTESQPDALPKEERQPASHHVPDRRKEKIKLDIAPVPAQGACSNVYPAAPTIAPSTTGVAVAKESGAAASAVSAAPVVSTARAMFPETPGSMPGVAATTHADTSAETSEIIIEAQDPIKAGMTPMPNLSPLKEAVGHNTAGEAMHDISATFVGEAHAMSEGESSAALPADEQIDLPQSGHLTGASPTRKVSEMSQTSAIAPPALSSDLQALADAFETSVRYFERGGDHWIGSAHFTLQSSTLKGATFQLISDGKSLSILLSEFSDAPVSISLRQESQLSKTLTQKLGRNVSLNLIASEIESVESTDASEYAEQQ